MLSTTVALAISEVAASIDCRLEIVKIRRCSNDQARAADAISKMDMQRFRWWMPRSSLAEAKAPRALVDWVNNPREDRLLGEKILKEMGVRKHTLGHQSQYY